LQTFALRAPVSEHVRVAHAHLRLCDSQYDCAEPDKALALSMSAF